MNPTKDKDLHILLRGKSPDKATDIILSLMKKQDVRVLSLCHNSFPDDVLSDEHCQRIAESGLKDIHDNLKSMPVSTSHMFSGAVLVGIKDLRLVKKYLWKDHSFVHTMETFLKFAKMNAGFVILRDIAIHIIQALLLGGTPNSFIVLICESEVLDLYASILENHEVVATEQAYEEISLTFLLLCQYSEDCVQKFNKLNLSTILLKFSQWSKLSPHVKEKAKVASSCIQHMIRLEKIPDHKKKIMKKFSDHINTANKNSKLVETVCCSNLVCSKEQQKSFEIDSTHFKKCGRCRISVYCSKECQVAHWKAGHSKNCAPPSW